MQRLLMALVALTVLLAMPAAAYEPEVKTAEAAPASILVHPDTTGAVGVWSVTWDRSDTGWSPTHFHGTLVITADQEIGLQWTESFTVPRLVSVHMEGDTVTIKMQWDPASSTTIRGIIDGDAFLGHMKSTSSEGSIPWSPFTGERVPMLAHVE
jgi:hypothetical protein